MLYYATFGQGAYARSRLLAGQEAAAMGIFERCFVLGAADLQPEFLAAHGEFLRTRARGYGYWVWKPQVILQVLREIPEGACLLYADAGCTLAPENAGRVLEYAARASAHPRHMLTFFMPPHAELAWNKGDTVRAVYPGVRDGPQINATAMVIRNGPDTRTFVAEWLRLCTAEGYRLVDDTPSAAPNAPHFVEHRHDQSIFSLLCKREGVLCIPDETDGPGPAWRAKGLPVFAARRKAA